MELWCRSTTAASCILYIEPIIRHVTLEPSRVDEFSHRFNMECLWLQFLAENLRSFKKPGGREGLGEREHKGMATRLTDVTLCRRDRITSRPRLGCFGDAAYTRSRTS